MLTRKGRRSDVGGHALSAVLLCLTLVAATLLAVTSRMTGVETDWRSAAPAFLLIAAALAVWGYLLAYPGRNPREWLVGEGALVFALLLGLSVVLLPAQYSSAALNRPVIDAVLARADAALGIHVPTLVTWSRSHPALVKWLGLAYDSLAIQFVLAIPLLVIAGRRVALWEYAFHFHTCALVTLLVFAAFPAECAFNYYGFTALLPQDSFTAQFTMVRAGQLRTLQFGAMEGLVSAPSFHVAGALMLMWAARGVWWLLVPSLVLNLSLCAATFLTGTHYVVDVLLALAMFGVSALLWRRWHVPLLGLARQATTPSRY